MNTIKDLKALWDKEKEEYRKQEIGTGVQKFVKEVFECSEIFGLKHGMLSTEGKKRKNEFITEGRKKGRRADVVIFIDKDIIIPVEIEKTGNVKAGIHQIFNYQADWSKKLGILTDGNEWVFYVNRTVVKKFKIDDIFSKPNIFKEYWKSYTELEFYYQSFFQKNEQQELFSIPSPTVDEKRTEFFEDITILIENFQEKLDIKGYFKQERTELERKKRAVEITYAYFIQFILYKVLVDNAFGTFENEWNNIKFAVEESIFKKKYTNIFKSVKSISDKISERIYKRFNDEQENINERLKKIIEKTDNTIEDASAWLDILLFIDRYNFANVQNEIFGYVYENYLKDLYEDKKKGQYFTDPHVVEFMLNEIGYTKEILSKKYLKDSDSISMIDPSCGSGTFLYNATNRLVDAFFKENSDSSLLTSKLVIENIFGLDIAEFPLYLAEMNILMRMLPVILNEKFNNPFEKKINTFKTRDSISEFMDTPLNNTLTDINIELKKKQGQLSFFSKALDLEYDSFMRDKRILKGVKQSLEIRGKIPRQRFDFVIGNPPYISYNECASQNILVFELMREGKVKLSEIYGLNLHSVEENRKKYPPKPNLYSFFIALGLGLLKDYGRICYIIPQTLITESDYDVLRWHLAKYTTIEKIFLFENSMFIGRGLKQSNKIATSSLIFIIKKEIPTNSHKIQIFNYEKQEDEIIKALENIKNPKKSKCFEIKQGVLLKNYLNWIILKLDNQTIELYDEYKSNSESLNLYSEHKLSQSKFNSIFYFDVGFILDKSKYLKEKIKGDEFELINFQDFVGYSKFDSKEFYPNDIDLIQLPKNSQGHITLSKKFKIIWAKVYSNKFYFTDKKILPSMSFTQFISSDNKVELIYLFSLLNSKTNNFIFNKLFKLGNEKIGVFIVVKRIKEFLKIPQINSVNIEIREQIIKSTSELIEIENSTLSDFVDFQNIMLQKFDKVEVTGNLLIIKYKDKVAKCKITGNPEIVIKAIAPLKVTDLFSENENLTLSNLKSMSAFDIEYQAQIKDYVDDLVYALYFKIKLPEIDFENAQKIKEICKQHKFYNLINSN